MGSPYWRSNMGYMCEMRGELKCHWGVCTSLLGREGPDQVRISGLTILPPPGQLLGTVMILAFLNGPFKVSFLGANRSFKGVEIVAIDDKTKSNIGRPMVLTFAPTFWTPKEIELLNGFRSAMNAVMVAPDQTTADEADRAFQLLLQTAREMRQQDSGGGRKRNDWFPDAEARTYGATLDSEVGSFESLSTLG